MSAQGDGWEVFIFDYVMDLTHSYHSGGGLVVVARGLDEAKRLVAAGIADPDLKKQPEGPTAEDWESAKRLPLAGEQEPAVHIHADSGCC